LAARPGSASRDRRLAVPGNSSAFEYETDNPVDRHAVAVIRADGRQFGYLSAELATEVYCLPPRHR
jgi:hypothetical protein